MGTKAQWKWSVIIYGIMNNLYFIKITYVFNIYSYQIL